MSEIYKVVHIEEVKLDTAKPVFVDTETDGLYGRIELAQFYQEDWPQVLLVRKPSPVVFASMLSSCLTVMHNAHYDITTTQDNMNKSHWIPERYFDTFFAARIALPSLESFSLDSVMTAVIGFDPYAKAGLDKHTLQKSDWSKFSLSEEQKLYAAIDVYHLPAVYNAVKHVEDSMSYILDIRTLNVFMDIQQNGLPIREEYVSELIYKTRTALDKIHMPINPNSYKQVRSWLNIDSSDKEALSRLFLNGDQRAGDILETRKLRKQISYLEKILDIVEEHGRLYGKLKCGARSGRATSDQENIQQIPRALKGIIGYEPEDGRVLIFADYAQLELRTICAILGVSLMDKMFRDGTDLHAFTAEMLFGKDWKKEHRLYAKGANFGLLYAGGVSMFIGFMISIASVILEDRMASSIRAKWRNLWKEIYQWQQIGIRKHQRGELGSTPLGRPYKANRVTDYLNIENQGAGAEVAKLALVYLNRDIAKYIADNNLSYDDVKIINFTHDSYIIDTINDEKVYTDVSIILAKAMQLAWFEMSKLYKIKDVPMPVDVRAGYDWKSIDSDDGFKLFQYELDGMHMLEYIS